ncbi:5-formyltetrahydrofolate cyclo-ligase [Streptococcus himalayensis]|uniref:5-formyltetrahydrofolate cyclo-ligase n=1 Tax=Streptococcus himalayensis TaxID=1888195 RepID=A0A917A2Z9_9STRE|nr:5-formyltetrahydrofolate cyclo-ligase [Streptococcus himalayensis]GGE24256.1 5-formyltetrahydrofolate cyclo-ligase [Streptococcus himalayensis]
MKDALRQEVLSWMKDFSGAEKERADEWLIGQILASTAYQKAKVLATYLSFSHEMATDFLIATALKDGKQVLVPKTYPQGRMIFVDYNPEQLVQTSFGLLEPRSELAVDPAMIDLIHVPGVVFTKEGYRIGYGGGYYDRYLADYKGKTVSTIYGFQERDFEPEVHDIQIGKVYKYGKTMG